MLHVLWAMLRWAAASSLRATVLAVLVFLVSLVGRRWLRPGWTYALWLLVFLQLALPRVPAIPLNMYSLLPSSASVGALAPIEQAVVGPGLHATPLVASGTHTSSSAPVGPRTGAGVSSPTTPSTTGATTKTAPTSPLPGWQLALVSLWLAGIVFFMGKVAVGERRLRRKLRLAQPVTDPRVLSLWNECVEASGQKRRPGLAETDSIVSPALLGVIRPRVLLPIGMTAQLADQELRHVFTHELVHHRRLDIAVSWAATALELLHWFNPLVWWGFGQMTDAQELACDAVTVGRIARRTATEYGQTIIHLLELTRGQDPRVPSAAGITRKGSLNRRRIHLIKMLRTPQGAMAKVAAVACALTVALAAGCGSLTGPRADPGPAPATSAVLSQLWAVADRSSSTSAPGIPTIAGKMVIVSGPGPILAAYALQDGKRVWQRALPGDAAVSPGAPLVVGNDVLLVDGTTLLAFDAPSGSLLWQKDIVGLHLAGATLQAVGGGVLVPADGLPLYNASTGQLIRDVASGVHIAGANNSQVAVQGNTVMVVDSTGDITAYDLAGRTVWHSAPPAATGPQGQPAAVAYRGIDAAGNGVAVAMEGVVWQCTSSNPGACTDNGTLNAVGLDLSSGAVRWVQPQGTTQPLAVGSASALAVEDSGLELSLTDGKSAWALPGSGGAYYWVAPAEHRTFIAFDPLHGHLLAVSASGRTLATATLPSNQGLDQVSHLAVGGGYVAVVTGAQELDVFTLKT